MAELRTSLQINFNGVLFQEDKMVKEENNSCTNTDEIRFYFYCFCGCTYVFSLHLNYILWSEPDLAAAAEPPTRYALAVTVHSTLLPVFLSPLIVGPLCWNVGIN